MMKDLLIRLSYVILPAWGLLLLTFALPAFDLDGPVAVGACWLAASGSLLGVPLIAAVMIVAVLGRHGISTRRRVREAVVLAVSLTVVLGGSAYVNEHVVKPWFAVPRPDIVSLAESGSLGMTAEEFYSLPDKSARSRYLRDVLTAKDFHAVALDPRVRDHWIAETGFSFPSGHSLTAMILATLFAGTGFALLRGPRRWIVLLLVPWAVLVCYSRVILRVHRPADVVCGALAGMLIGALAFALLWRFLWTDETPDDPAFNA